MNIVFDIGRVIVRWEPAELIDELFADPAARATVHSAIVEHADWLALDRGTLPQQDAIARAAERTGLSEEDVAGFFQRVPPALVAIPETIDLLYRLKAKAHRLFCLSNMHAASIEHLEKVYRFWEVFEGMVISSRIHLIKPEPAIYAYLLEQHGLNGEETVFIDDAEVNLAPAAKLGIHTIQFESPAQCERQLKLLGCV